jgi:hypothetical protein
MGVLVLAGPLAAQTVPPAPLTIDQLGQSPDGPLRPEDQAFDAEVRQTSAAAASRLGPMEGSWRLTTPEGTALFGFQLTDLPTQGEGDVSGGGIEGAWRDLRRRSALAGSGFIAEIQRQDNRLSLRLYEREGDPATVIELSTAASEVWTGTLSDGTGKTAVIMRRD